MLKDDTEKQKLLEKITNDVMKDLIYDCVAVPERKKQDDSGKDSQANHDVYLIDQLQSEKEEKKEWIELR